MALPSLLETKRILNEKSKITFVNSLKLNEWKGNYSKVFWLSFNVLSETKPKHYKISIIKCIKAEKNGYVITNNQYFTLLVSNSEELEIGSSYKSYVKIKKLKNGKYCIRKIKDKRNSQINKRDNEKKDNCKINAKEVEKFIYELNKNYTNLRQFINKYKTRFSDEELESIHHLDIFE